jgi:spore germination protein
MAQTSSARQWGGSLATWVSDYAALARVADRIQIMAYDDHTPGGAPGPIAPLPWVQSVIAYAGTQIPPSRVELGVPAYGYDWSGRGGVSLTATQAAQLAIQVHARLRWQASQGEETFTYRRHRRRYTVWYENATSDYDRARLAAAAGFAGIAIWAAGDEDPRLWPLLRALR